jgi:hypothetical protein
MDASDLAGTTRGARAKTPAETAMTVVLTSDNPHVFDKVCRVFFGFGHYLSGVAARQVKHGKQRAKDNAFHAYD